MNVSTACHLQLSAAVRLRREAWGGVAFDRAGGDLLDVDPEGFAVLTALRSAHSLPALQRSLRRIGYPGRRSELSAFLHSLERGGFVRRVPSDVTPLPADCWVESAGSGDGEGLRAPLVAHWAVTYRCNLHCAFCYSDSGPQRS